MTMMVHDKLKKETQMNLLSKTVNFSGFLVNVILKLDQNEPAMEACTENSVNNWFILLVQSEIIGYVTKKDKTKVKTIERGVLQLWLDIKKFSNRSASNVQP